MRLSHSLLSIALGLIAFCGHVSGGDSSASLSRIALSGAPRHNLDGVLPILDIEEQYIRSQTDGAAKAFGDIGLQCSASSPCPDGSCCNSNGQCGYRDEHCKVSCVANCDAMAPCGVNSKNGSQKCPLNVCCSHFGFCGASSIFCRDETASGQSTPCQKDFGNCDTVSTQPTPSCGKDSDTASRKIAYYQGWNTRRRPCDKVWPADIVTTGLTHLIFSFATIEPNTFDVVPMHLDDEKLYTDFLALKDGSKKWIGIGGWEFSDPGSTHHTWSYMASSKANRDSFITSLLKFLDKWNFSGVDIDWEWPGAESRGGNPSNDKQNYGSLLTELREALGSRGLSIALPAQYEYLKYFDPKAMEAQVDFFNVLTYDLHGPWDATTPGLGPLVKPHTDLKDIDTALDLFWFSDVTPAKINLGLSNYARGYTLADPTCAHYGCKWTGPSRAGECTDLSGVLSQREIARIISQKNLRPELIKDAGVKQIVFDGQWIGYDDSETLSLKTELANDRCLGGTALWAIDYALAGGGGPGGPSVPQSSSAAISVPAPGVSMAPSSASDVQSSAHVTPSAPASSPVQSSAGSTATSVPAQSKIIPSAPPTSEGMVTSNLQTSSAVEPSVPVASSSFASSTFAPTLVTTVWDGVTFQPPTQNVSMTFFSSTTKTGSVVVPVFPPPQSELMSTQLPTLISSGSTTSASSPHSSSGKPITTPVPVPVPVPVPSWGSHGTSTIGSISAGQPSAPASPGPSSQISVGPSQSAPESTPMLVNTTITVPSVTITLNMSSSVTHTPVSSMPWANSSSIWTSNLSATRLPIIVTFTTTDSAGSTVITTQSSFPSAPAVSDITSGHSSAFSLPTIPTSLGPTPTGLLLAFCPDCAGASWCSAWANKDVNELPEFPPAECIENDWCLKCWPKPVGFNIDLCPLQCWLLNWCHPLCLVGIGDYPEDPPDNSLDFPWFAAWWWTLRVKGCQPNDCAKECIEWTCTKGEKADNVKHKKCKLLGCGCGWMGLPIGPGCHIDFIFPPLFPVGIFGLNPCKFFGGCKLPPPPSLPTLPPGPPPPPPPPGDEWADEGCGPLGCHGYCYTEDGCDPCPPELCKGPQRTRPGGCGPRPGKDPKLDPTRKPKCEDKDKTTVTERIVTCFESLKVEPTTIASINFTMTNTITSACIPFEATYTGCGILGTTTTSTASSFSTVSSSEVPYCTRAPLDLINDQGDNIHPSQPTNEGPTCSRAPLSLDDDIWDIIDDPAFSMNVSMSMDPTAFSSNPFATLSPTANSTVFSSGTFATLSPTANGTLMSSTGMSSPTFSSDMSSLGISATLSPTINSTLMSSTSLSSSTISTHTPTVTPTSRQPSPTTTASVISSDATTQTASTISISYSPTPTCNAYGRHTTPNGKWTALIEHEIKRDPNKATLSWTLWDENGCEAGGGSGTNEILGQKITQEIGAINRPKQDRMGYNVHVDVTDSLSTSDSTIDFLFSVWIDGCRMRCWPKWQINNRDASESWKIIENCARQCGGPKFGPDEVSCSDDINKWHDAGSTSHQKRGGYCTWRMPYKPGDDTPQHHGPASWTRASQWSLDIIQWMEYDKSSMEWWLKDPDGNNASHYWWDTSNISPIGSTTIDPDDRQNHPLLTMRYNVNVTVANPRKKDSTTVRLTYVGGGHYSTCKYCDRKGPCPVCVQQGAHCVVSDGPATYACDPYYQTESDDEKQQSLLEICSDKSGFPCPSSMLKDNTEFSCDKVANAFYPLGAGFERRFRCWWPNDFVDPYWSKGDLF